MADPVVRYDIPEQRRAANGWAINPIGPWVVRCCPLHGDYQELGGRGCYRCQTDRSARARASRLPPRPPHEKDPGCNMCGRFPLPGRRRSWCSDQCVELWWLASDPTFARGHYLRLMGPACWDCGERPATDLDHVRPLWSLTDAQRLELRWWLPFNHQMLCPRCHKAKTRREAGVRAEVRRNPRRGFVLPDSSEQLPLFGQIG